MMRRSLTVILVCLVLAGCGDGDDGSPPPSAPLRAGAAEGTLDLPIGLPLAGYVDEHRTIFPFAAQPVDVRERPYTSVLVPSTGQHTRITVKVLALESEGGEVVVVKVDLIFAYAGLTEALEDRLSAATGRSFENRVVLTANHSHNSYGDFTQDVALEVGTDTYRQEIFDRMLDRITAVAAEAVETQRPARIGIGIDEEFDPDDEIFRDRRVENDILDANGHFIFSDPGCAETYEPSCRVVTDSPARRGPGKDNRLAVVRVDDAATGRPIALLMNFGIHGTVLGSGLTKLHRDEDGPGNLFVSVEAPGMIEQKTEKRFDRPVVVMHVQSSAGDVAPAGDRNGHRDFQRMEVIGEVAAGRVIRLFDDVRTGGDVGLEALTRAIPQSVDTIRVTRGGTVGYRYPPDLGMRPCDGDPLTFEDFAFPFGAPLCGEEAGAQIDASTGCVGVYASCGDLTSLGAVLPAIDPGFTGQFPAPGTDFTLVGAVRLAGVPVTRHGSTAAEDVLIAALPGEPVSVYTEHLRGRARALGFDDALAFGYSQDHEGYLLTVEDWLAGGVTEVQINVWGPLQQEYILDQTLALAGLLRTPEREDPAAGFPDPVIPGRAPTDVLQAPILPEDSPDAGEITVQPPAEVERLGFVRVTFLGGDPTIDTPRVSLERRDGGRWVQVMRSDGRPLDDAGYEIVVTYQPDPLQGEQREHRYTAHFEVVSDEPDIASFASFRLGVYRLRIEGTTAGSDDVPYPFLGILYAATTEPFEIVAADDLVVTFSGAAGTITGQVTYPPATGFRLHDPASPPDMGSPVRAGTVRARVDRAAGAAQTVRGAIGPDGRFTLSFTDSGALIEQVTITAEDRWGNSGTAGIRTSP
jgi:hypothetical protein